MKIETLLKPHKNEIIKKWFTIAIDTYPPETSIFLKRQKDPFANPVGNTIFQGLEEILDALLEGKDSTILSSSLEPIIRIRALQNFTPPQAVSFLFSLKKVIRELFNQEIQSGPIGTELLRFESMIDDLVLIAFNIYMERKEKLYEIKANEERKRTFRAFERAGLMHESRKDEPDL